MKTMFLFVAGIFLSLSAFAQPLPVDGNTIALWNFENDLNTVVFDNGVNNIHGTAFSAGLVETSPINLGRARFFVDQTAYLSFPAPQNNSPLDLNSKNNWTIEFRVFLLSLASVKNVYSSGGVVVQIEDGRLSAVINSFGISYGLKTDLQLNVNTAYRIAVVNTPSEIAIVVNNKVWASQLKGHTKATKTQKAMLSPVFIGGGENDFASRVSLGFRHACATGSSGQLYCWGSNEYGQSGRGMFGGYSNLPLPVEKMTKTTQISSGDTFSCGISDNKLYCWGANDSYELGLPLIGPSSTPIYLMDAENITSIASGFQFSCAIFSNQEVKCWGENGYGQLGIGIYTQKNIPTIAPGLFQIKKIALGSEHGCAIDRENNVLCWGNNTHGQIGSTVAHSPVPTPVPGVTGATHIAVGDDHSCALLDTNEIVCWGRNHRGQLGNGTTTSSNVPVYVSGIAPDVPTSIHAGPANHTCATLSTKRVKCWGSNESGQLGRPNLPVATTAGDAGLFEVNQIVSGGSNSCFIKFRGLACIGSNSMGMLGRGSDLVAGTHLEQPALIFRPSSVAGFMDDIRISNVARVPIVRPKISLVSSTTANVPNPPMEFAVDSSLPLNANTLTVRVNGFSTGGLTLNGMTISGTIQRAFTTGTNRIEISIMDTSDNLGKISVDINFSSASVPQAPAQIASSGINTCYLDHLGDVYCWGSNKWGQLGITTTHFSSTPVKNPWLKKISKIAVTEGTVCALNLDGEVLCLGSNIGGQLGTGANITSRAFPKAIPMGAQVIDLYNGQNSFCLKLINNELQCWGVDIYGALGLTNHFTYYPQTSLGTNFDIKKISIGVSHACYIKNDNSLWCRGFNNSGEVGDGTNATRTSLTKVLEIGPVKDVVASKYYTCAIEFDDSVSCWGQNHGAQFGTGVDPVDSYYPFGWRVPIHSTIPGSVRSIHLGDGFGCAFKFDNSLLCWGANEKGEIGNGFLTHTPEGYSHPGPFKSVSVNSSTVCVVDLSDKIQCWGSNSIGQAGNSISGPVVVPTEVVPHTTILPFYHDLVSGEGNSCLQMNGYPYCWGNVTQGQLGMGYSTRAYEKYPVKLSKMQNIVQSAIGYAHICHLNSTGEVYCAGDNQFLQCGTNAGSVSEYHLVGGLPAIKQIEASESSTCALDINGNVWCWGSNSHGQLGNAQAGQTSSTPVQVAISNVTSIELPVRGHHACAIVSEDRYIYCWGSNNARQIAPTGISQYPTPIEVRTLRHSIQIAADNISTCGLSPTGAVSCGEYNYFGNAGLGNNVRNLSWDIVDYKLPFKAIRAGSNHICGLDIQDQLLCWGKNDQGQIGVGTETFSVNRPQYIMNNVREFALGGDHSCAITNENRMACWGFNGNGQFATGNNEDSSLPVFSDFSKKL